VQRPAAQCGQPRRPLAPPASPQIPAQQWPEGRPGPPRRAAARPGEQVQGMRGRPCPGAGQHGGVRSPRGGSPGGPPAGPFPRTDRGHACEGLGRVAARRLGRPHGGERQYFGRRGPNRKQPAAAAEQVGQHFSCSSPKPRPPGPGRTHSAATRSTTPGGGRPTRHLASSRSGGTAGPSRAALGLPGSRMPRAPPVPPWPPT
jgi:hypothetical protein